MSAIAMEIGDDGILIAADGVCYNSETGEVRGFASKLISCPELDCVIGWTGVAGFGRALYLEMGDAFDDFDHLANHFEDLALTVHDDFLARNDLESVEVSVIIAGWSNEDQKFKGYRVFSYPKQSINMATGETIDNEPWTMIEMPGSWCSYSPKQDKLEACGLGDFDAVPRGDVPPRMICAARASSKVSVDEDTGEMSAFNAGCFLQMVHITRGSVNSWIAHRWHEDVIGEPIDPSKGDLLPEWLAKRGNADE